MAKFIVTVSREIEFAIAFEVEATAPEQARVLAQKQASTLATDTTKWIATVHANNISVYPKLDKDLS